MPTSLQQRGLLLVIGGLLLSGALILVADHAALNVDLVSHGADSAHSGAVSLDVVVLSPTFRDGPSFVDLNTADEQELMRLSGIGEVLAARIIAFREMHGPFGTVEELAGVSGIGPVLIEAIRAKVTLEPLPPQPSADSASER